MPKTSLSASEKKRLAALRNLDILDTPPEKQIDRFTRLAAKIFDVPISLVSLVDENRQWFKSACGLDASETPRDWAFCAHAILHDDAFIILDASKDHRFKDNPLVTGDPDIRFYAGYPLKTSEGDNLGTLCVIDRKPRDSFDADQIAILKELAESVTFEIEHRSVQNQIVADALKMREATTRLARVEADLLTSKQRFDLAIAGSSSGLWDWDLSNDNLFWSPRFLEIIGRDPKDTMTHLDEFEDRLHPDDTERVMLAVDKHLKERIPYNIDYRLRHEDGTYRWIHAFGQALWDEDGKAIRFAGSMDDVTDRVNNEKAMQASEQRFALAAKGSSVGIWEWLDVNTDKVFWTDRLYELLGYKPGEIEASFQLFSDLLHPDDREMALEQLQTHLRDGTDYSMEMRQKHKTDGYRWYWGTGIAERDENGQPVRMVGTLMDIHDRKMAEKALTESENRFALAVQGTNVGIWDWMDVNENAEFWSDQFYRLLGYEPGEIEASLENFEMLLHPDDKEATLANVDAHLKGEGRFEIEYRLRHKTEGYKWFLGAALLDRDDQGNPVRMVGSIMDINDRKLAEQLIHQKEAELQLIFNNVPVRIWLKDDKNKIIRLNEEAAKSMNMAISDAEGADTYDLFPEMAKKYHDDDLEVFKSGKPKLGIVEEYTPLDGDKGWVRTDKVPFVDPETGDRLLFVSSIDVTEVKRSEDALRVQSEDLRQSNAELEQFAYVASHDLQEPLRMVSGYCDLLSRRYGDRLDDDGREFIDFAVDGATRMQALLNDLLDYSRAGRIDFKFAPIDLQSLLEVVKHDLSNVINDNDATIRHQDLSLVYGDAGQVRRVIQNLIHNSIKFQNDTKPVIEISTEDRAQDIVVRVQDNGIGIDPTYAGRIFEIFQRLHTRDKYPGTGIGLSIAKRIVERHGGQIWLEKPPSDVGTIIAFSLNKPAEA